MFDERVDEVLRVVGRLVVLALASAATLFVLGIALKPALPLGLPMGDAGRIIFAIMVGLSLAVGHLVVVVALQRSRWEVAGLGEDGWRPLTLLASIGIGALAVGLPGVVLVLTEQVRLDAGLAGSWGPFALRVLLPAAVFALVEELIFRGYLLGLLADRWGAAIAIAVTSVLFGIVHVPNPGASVTGLAAVIAAGVLLGAIRLRTMSLAAAWLAHLALNWMQVAVFHAPVPWLEVSSAPGYRMVPVGPGWLTGGSLGLEGGVASVLTIAALTVLVHKVWIPPKRPSRR